MPLVEEYYIRMTFVLEVRWLDPKSLSNECHSRVKYPLPRTHVSLPNSDSLPTHPKNSMSVCVLNDVIQSSLQILLLWN